MVPRLTIAIPTYNRAARLRAQLARLAPQLGPEVRCCVYDNGSTDDTPRVTATFVAQGVSVFRNATNLGAEHNLFRCFEECETDWLWVLGDDDPAEPTAVGTILHLTNRGDLDFLHLSTTTHGHAQAVEVTDPLTLLDRTSPAALNFISLSVYNMRSFRPLLPGLLEQISNMVAQMTMILRLFESGQARGLLSPAAVVSAPTGAPRWSTLRWVLGMSLALEFTRDERLQRRLAAILVVENFNWAFLCGLREADAAAGRRRWKRIYSKASSNYAAHVRFARLKYVLGNFYKPGRRKTCWWMFIDGLLLSFLRWSPSFVLAWLRPAICRRMEPTAPAGDQPGK